MYVEHLIINFMGSNRVGKIQVNENRVKIRAIRANANSPDVKYAVQHILMVDSLVPRLSCPQLLSMKSGNGLGV